MFDKSREDSSKGIVGGGAVHVSIELASNKNKSDKKLHSGTCCIQRGTERDIEKDADEGKP